MSTVMKSLVRLAPVFGMDPEARGALGKLGNLAGSARVAVPGRFMPDAGVTRKLAEWGVAEGVDEADFFRFDRVVLPYCGVAPALRKRWEEKGIRVEDLTSPQVRRAQVALGLLRLDGGQPLVIGRHGDPESLALAAAHPGTRILEDTTDTARLKFHPAFGVVCQTTLSPRKVSWLVQQLRLRYNDAKVTFLDTLAPAMAARDRALERLAERSDRVVIVGRKGESSCEALAETALRKGMPTEIVESGEEAERLKGLGGSVALTAGAFALDATIREVADRLMGG